MKKRFITACLSALAVLLVWAAGGAAQGQTTSDPQLPLVFLDTAYVPATGRTINVPAGGDLRAALNLAEPGDEIVLQAGATYLAPDGGFVLPPKSGDGWIIVRTSNMAGIAAEGERLDPSQHAAAMPKIVSRNVSPALAAITRSGQAAPHHYRFVGIEFTFAPGVTLNYGLVMFGTSGSAQATAESVPHHLILDRCYVHGNATADLIRGVALNSAYSAVIDSYISDCHAIGADSQAICGWNGPGPFKIVNNYLEGAGENVMFGGSDPTVPGLVPSDIEFRRNHCFKPLAWKKDEPTFAGKAWTVKNLFELKNARRVLIDGNLFEHNWVHGQTGVAILFTVRNQGGKAPWSVVEDVTFTNNIVRHTAAGMTLMGHDYNYPSRQTRRVLVRNNLFEDVGSSRWGSNGRLFQIDGGTADEGPADVTIDHNTAFQTGHIIMATEYFRALAAYSVKPGFVFTNNLMPHNAYGVFGSNRGSGLPALNTYFPGHVFTKNVLAGGKATQYPAGNFFPATLDAIGFADRARGDYRLALNSPYKNAGTDGRDLGADIDRIYAAMASEEQPEPNRPPAVTVTASATAGVAPLSVGFVADAVDADGQVVDYEWSFGDGASSPELSPVHVYSAAGRYTARLTVRDNAGASASAAVEIVVSEPVPNQPPQVTIYATPQSGSAPLTVKFAASAADSDGQVVAYLWQFGDGQTSSLPNPSHVYQGAGSYTARVTVTDDDGATATASVEVVVTEPAPALAVEVLTPNGGESLRWATRYTISWSVSGGTPRRQDIQLSIDGGATWRSVMTGLKGSARSSSWLPPKLQTSNARIRVIVYDATSSAQDLSDADFTIRRK